MELNTEKLQEVVEKIAYQQLAEEQIDDLVAKMSILNEYVQEQLRLFAVMPSCEGNCGMNYCDDNGCIERKRILVEPKDLTEREV
jgi:hypothetical protein